jgi:hypothetical protein
VRAGLGKADVVTDAAAQARDEIGRAIADKIRELKKPGELAKMAENVLPTIEEFLESPEEKRLRRMRSAVITSAIGLGVLISFIMVALAADDPGLLIPAGGGLVTFLIGMAMMLNAKLFTVPKTQIPQRTLTRSETTLLRHRAHNAQATERSGNRTLIASWLKR